MRILKNSRFLLITSAAILLSPSAFANNSAPEVVSSLCQPEVTQNLDCEESRTCAFRTQSAIEDFFEKYEAPTPKKFKQIQYPNYCSSNGSRRHAVNLTYNVGPDGKPQGVQVLNSTDECFSKAAKAHFEKVKFKASEQGYSCVPATISYVAGSRDSDDLLSGFPVDSDRFGRDTAIFQGVDSGSLSFANARISGVFR